MIPCFRVVDAFSPHGKQFDHLCDYLIVVSRLCLVIPWICIVATFCSLGNFIYSSLWLSDFLNPHRWCSLSTWKSIWSSLPSLSSCPRGCQWLGKCDQHRLVTIDQWLNHGQYFCLFTKSGFIQRLYKNKKFTKKCQFWKLATNSVQSPRSILWGKGHGRPCYHKGWTWGAQHLAWGHCQKKIRNMPKKQPWKKTSFPFRPESMLVNGSPLPWLLSWFASWSRITLNTLTTSTRLIGKHDGGFIQYYVHSINFLSHFTRLAPVLIIVSRYFIPSANPDGYAYSWEHDRLWRKTRWGIQNRNIGKPGDRFFSSRINFNGPAHYDFRSDNGGILGCKGVDPNRNWGRI